MVVLKEYIKKYRTVRAAILFSIAAFFFAGALYLYFHNPEEIPFLPCMIHRLTGLYCPGCGAGRASYALMHLEFYKAFRYNPVMVFVMPLLAIYFAARSLDWVITGGNHVDRYVPDRFLYWLLVGILVYGVLRNIPYFPFELLAPTRI